MKEYDGWCMKAADEIMPWWYYKYRTQVVKNWDKMWDDKYGKKYKWRNLRKKGTHKIVKVKIQEVE